MVTDAEIDTFWRDGVVCLRGVLAPDVIAAMAEPVEEAIGSAQSADLSALAGAPAASARFVAGIDHWRRQPAMRAFAADSAAARVPSPRCCAAARSTSTRTACS